MRLQHHPPLQRLLWERIHTERLSGRAADETARAMTARLEPHAASDAPVPGAGLAALIEATLAALTSAPPAELLAAGASLTGLHRRLGEVLAHEQPAGSG